MLSKSRGEPASRARSLGSSYVLPFQSSFASSPFRCSTSSHSPFFCSLTPRTPPFAKVWAGTATHSSAGVSLHHSAFAPHCAPKNLANRSTLRRTTEPLPRPLPRAAVCLPRAAACLSRAAACLPPLPPLPPLPTQDGMCRMPIPPSTGILCAYCRPILIFSSVGCAVSYSIWRRS
eukprot:SAG11_NODE_2628_length_3159_cov_6.484967_3_plen_176_part_00